MPSCGATSRYLWKILGNEEQASTVLILAFPASIFVGLLSNVVVFMGLNDFLVRTPFRKKRAELFALHAKLSQQVREKCWTALGLNDPALKRSFDEWADPEIIIVERIGADKLAYVREQYWFHLEFQLNLLISFGAIFVALVVSGFHQRQLRSCARDRAHCCGHRRVRIPLSRLVAGRAQELTNATWLKWRA